MDQPDRLHRYRGAAPLAFRRMARRAEAPGWFRIIQSVVIAVYYAAVIARAASYFVCLFDQRRANAAPGSSPAQDDRGIPERFSSTMD